ncbi:MAG: AAA family ATPase [Planctomycetia bacterium]|nr:AAA family ATPase [Planctomycetia bacterium]
MILRSLEIDRFGAWQGLKIGNLSEGLNLFYGPNEIGKTTLMQFLRSIFYGFSVSRLSYLSAEDTPQCGGRLDIETSEGAFSLFRHAGEHTTERAERHGDLELPFFRRPVFVERFRTQKFDDGLEILDRDGARKDSFFLQRLLGISSDNRLDEDERLYTNIFAVGLSELQQLAVLDSTDAAARLYQLSTGLFRHGLSGVLDRLEAERRRLILPTDRVAGLREEEIRLQPEPTSPFAFVPRWKHDSGYGEILEQIRHREILLRELENVRSRNRTYVPLMAEETRLAEQRAQLDEEIQQQEHHLRVLDLAETLRETWQKRGLLDDQIVAFVRDEQLGEVTEAGIASLKETLARIERSSEQMDLLRRQAEACRERMRQARETSDRPNVSDDFIRVIPRLESLVQQEEWIVTLEGRLEDLKRTVRDTEAQLAVDYRRVGLDEPDFTTKTPDLAWFDTRTLRTLRVPFREMHRVGKVAKKEREQKKALLDEAAALALKLDDYQAGLPARWNQLGISGEVPSLPAEVARILGETASQLRRRERAWQQLSQSLESEDELAVECRRKEAAMETPLPLLVGTGVIFVVGLTLTLFELVRLLGIFPPRSYLLSLFFFLLGTFAWMGCAAIKIIRDRRVRQAADDARSNLESLRAQIERQGQSAFPDDDLSDRQMLKEKCTQYLADTQKRLAMVSLDIPAAEEKILEAARRDALKRESQHHGKRLRTLRERWNEANARRVESLRALGLPETWKAGNVRRLMEASDRIHELWRRRARDGEDYVQYGQELTLLAGQTGDLLKLAGMEVPTEKEAGEDFFPYPSRLFAEIREKILAVRRYAQARSERKKAFTEAKREWRELREKYRREKMRLRRAQAGSQLADVEAIRQRIQRMETLREMRQKRKELQKDMDSVLEFSCSESTLYELYENNTPEQLAEKRKLVQVRLEGNRFQRDALRKRAEECRRSLEKMETDRTSDAIAYELSQTENRILQGLRYWRACAMASRLTETVQKTYEQRRQPKTLARASEFFETLTGGKYRRVWTPVEENLLYVDRRDGSLMAVEQLSTGTRELLFLALRLALIEGYRERGIVLPVILDDVLVNLDRRRATAAVEVLCEFAETGQILFFTAHEHIRDLLTEYDIPLCDMEKFSAKGT